MGDPLEIIRDYQMVRGVGLALAALAFFMGVAKLGVSDLPGEHARAQDLILKALFCFVVLAGDGMIARSIVTWFGLPADVLPVFWR